MVAANHFKYHSVQIHTSVINGKKQTRRNIVKVNGKKGVKTVAVSNGKKTRRNTKKLSAREISNIRKGKFMPGFFRALQ